MGAAAIHNPSFPTLSVLISLSVDHWARARAPARERETSPSRGHSRAHSHKRSSVGSDGTSEAHQDLAYSGQVRVRCTWVRFPEIWEWKTCPTEQRHKDEVSGLAFSWRDWGAGSGFGDDGREPELVLTSSSLGGQIKSWRWMWNSGLAKDSEGKVVCMRVASPIL